MPILNFCEETSVLLLWALIKTLKAKGYSKLCKEDVLFIHTCLGSRIRIRMRITLYLRLFPFLRKLQDCLTHQLQGCCHLGWRWGAPPTSVPLSCVLLARLLNDERHTVPMAQEMGVKWAGVRGAVETPWRKKKIEYHSYSTFVVNDC